MLRVIGKESIVSEINKARLENKNKWIGISINDGEIKLKIYNTWIQIAINNGIKDSSPMELKPKAFKEWLENYIDNCNIQTHIVTFELLYI